MKLFDPENRFWVFMDKITNVFILALCWFIFSLPVITCGAATVSLFQFTLKQTDNTEEYAFRSFRKAFVQNFKQATILWLIFIAGCIFFVFDFYSLLFLHMPKVIHIFAFAVAICLAFIFCITSFYAFPILACFKVSTKKALGDGLVMAFQHMSITFCIFDIYLFFAWAAYMRPFFSPFFLAIALFATSYLFRKIFNKYL